MSLVPRCSKLATSVLASCLVVGTIALRAETPTFPYVKADAPPHSDLSARVEKAKALVNEGKPYPKGCSEFVCEVLGIPWENADSLMGDASVSIGGKDQIDTYDLAKLRPGYVVGWPSSKAVADPNEHGHVAIYVKQKQGDPLFIDVPGNGKKPRVVKHGWGPDGATPGKGQEVFVSAKH